MEVYISTHLIHDNHLDMMPKVPVPVQRRLTPLPKWTVIVKERAGSESRAPISVAESRNSQSHWCGDVPQKSFCFGPGRRSMAQYVFCQKD